MRTAADPTSRLPQIYETQARDEHAARDARRDVADTLRYPLTTTGSGLYTHQASATASTSLCVVAEEFITICNFMKLHCGYL